MRSESTVSFTCMTRYLNDFRMRLPLWDVVPAAATAIKSSPVTVIRSGHPLYKMVTELWCLGHLWCIWGTLHFLLDTLGLFVHVGAWTAFLVPLQVLLIMVHSKGATIQLIAGNGVFELNKLFIPLPLFYVNDILFACLIAYLIFCK